MNDQELKQEVKELLDKIYQRRMFPTTKIRSRAFELYNIIFYHRSELYPHNPRGRQLTDGCRSCNVELIACLEKYIKE